VIVFKYPGNRKQNYIKRLVGLPHETIRIEHGDVFVGEDERSLTIARKPAQKLPYLLQLVHDTDYLSPKLRRMGWPPFWFDPSGSAQGWQTSQDQHTYHLAGEDQQTHWLRYRNVMPMEGTWNQLLNRDGKIDPAKIPAGLITDFYAYNAAGHSGRQFFGSWHWVGDLALEAEVQVRGDTGTLHLDLVEAGHHYRCDVDVQSGQASLTIDQGRGSFDPVRRDGEGPTKLTGQTTVQQKGPYRIRFANVDDQLLLWCNDSVVQFFDGEDPHDGTYPHSPDSAPRWSVADPGDLYPLGIGGTDVALSVHRLTVRRDIYYSAPDKEHEYGPIHDYPINTDYGWIHQVMYQPESWSQIDLFASRRSLTYKLGADQFFPMGDNSPASKDARIWSEWVKKPPGYEALEVEHFVSRELLIGKAFLVYWPHGWDLGPIPVRVVPNLPRMKWIR
jgi:signal peptidase I